jgi:hypothetical protein
VEELARDRESFVDEVERLAAGLDERERQLLSEILLERAQEEGAFAEAFERRVGAKGWLRRQWEKAGGS